MTGLLVIMGSGETTPSMIKPHRSIFERVGDRPAVLLDTPYGFQSNADDISARAVGYFAASIGRENEAFGLSEASVVASDYDATGSRARVGVLGLELRDQRLRDPTQDRPAARVEERPRRDQGVLRAFAVGQDHLRHALAALAADVGAHRAVLDDMATIESVQAAEQVVQSIAHVGDYRARLAFGSPAWHCQVVRLSSAGTMNPAFSGLLH